MALSLGLAAPTLWIAVLVGASREPESRALEVTSAAWLHKPASFLENDEAFGRLYVHASADPKGLVTDVKAALERSDMEEAKKLGKELSPTFEASALKFDATRLFWYLQEGNLDKSKEFAQKILDRLGSEDVDNKDTGTEATDRDLAVSSKDLSSQELGIALPEGLQACRIKKEDHSEAVLNQLRSCLGALEKFSQAVQQGLVKSQNTNAELGRAMGKVVNLIHTASDGPHIQKTVTADQDKAFTFLNHEISKADDDDQKLRGG